MEVVDGQQDRPAGGAGGEQRAHRPVQAVALGADPYRRAGGVADRARHPSRQPRQQARELQALIGPQAGEVLVGELRDDRFEGSQEDAERLVGLELGCPPEHRQAAALGGGSERVREQLRLADPGLAGDQDHVRLGGLAPAQQAVDLGQLVPANAQERLGQRLRPPHARLTPGVPRTHSEGLPRNAEDLHARHSSCWRRDCTLPRSIRPKRGSSQRRGHFATPAGICPV